MIAAVVVVNKMVNDVENLSSSIASKDAATDIR